MTDETKEPTVLEQIAALLARGDTQKVRDLESELARKQDHLIAYEDRLSPVVANAQKLLIQNGHYVQLRHNVDLLQLAISEAIADRAHPEVFIRWPSKRLLERYEAAEMEEQRVLREEFEAGRKADLEELALVHGISIEKQDSEDMMDTPLDERLKEE